MDTLTLRWAHDDHHHERAFAQGETAVLGRAAECDVRLPSDDRTIHRRHAEICWEAGAPVVKALGRNGVRLSSRPRPLGQGESARLARTDRLTVGESTIDTALQAAKGHARKLRCHNCDRVQDYSPEGMCVHCGFALASADTVFIQE